MSEAEEGNNEFHEQLKNLIEGSPMNWTCAILWQFSQPQLEWKFQSGYYRSTPKTKEVRILGSCVSVEEVNHTQIQRFFKVSQGLIFPNTKDLPRYASLSLGPMLVNTTDSSISIWRFGMMKSFELLQRTKWSHRFGIQTSFCIPMWKGTRELVLELASTEIIPYDPQWLQQMADFIHLIGTPHLLIEPPDPKELWNLLYVFTFYNNSVILDSQLRNKKRLHEREDNVMQNRGNNNTSKPSQDKEKINDSTCSRSILTKRSSDKGKEKISDSKCSWSILTESSHRGTNGTFSCSHDYSGPSSPLLTLTFDLYANE